MINKRVKNYAITSSLFLTITGGYVKYLTGYLTFVLYLDYKKKKCSPVWKKKKKKTPNKL